MLHVIYILPEERLKQSVFCCFSWSVLIVTYKVYNEQYTQPKGLLWDMLLIEKKKVLEREQKLIL